MSNESLSVGIFMGSNSDLPIVEESAKILSKFGVSYNLNVLSAHRTPYEVVRKLEELEKKGVKIFGSFDDSRKDKKFNYSTIIFISDQNLIEIITVYEQKNEIVEQIVKRIENSIDFVNG